MSNNYYNASGTPGTGAFAASAPMRSEFSSVASGFDLLPALSTGTASKAVIINSGGTAITVTTGTLALAGNFATTGAFNTTLIAGASVSLTLPVVSGTLATLAGTETLTNKTFVAPILGTPTSGDLTNCTGTAAGLTAGTALVVATNANLTGPITSVGNATSIASKTGTGTKFVVDTSPTLVTPNIGAATATTVNGLIITSTIGGSLSVTNNKTLSVNASITLAGTDGTVMTFPSTSAVVARSDSSNTFGGVQTFSTPIAASSVATMTATVGGGVPTPPNDTAKFLRGDGTFAVPSSGVTIGTSTVTGGVSTRILYNNTGVMGEYSITGTGTVVAMQTSPSFVTPTLGAATATTINGLTISSSTGTLTISNTKTLVASASLTLAGTDGTTLTFPSTSATIARTDAGQTFTGTQAFGAITYTTLNGNTWASGTGTLSIAAAKTLTASNTLTLAGTDATVMTFPTTSATIARTDSAQTFTGVQTFTAPILGTPTSVTLTNATGLPATGVVAGALANGMTATTQSASDNSTKVATTAYVDAAILQRPRVVAMCNSTGTTRNLQYNVASITKNSTGNYTFNFTNNVSANAVVEAILVSAGGGSGDTTIISQAASSVTIGTYNAAGSSQDFDGIQLVVFDNA